MMSALILLPPLIDKTHEGRSLSLSKGDAKTTPYARLTGIICNLSSLSKINVSLSNSSIKPSTSCNSAPPLIKIVSCSLVSSQSNKAF